MFRFATLAAVAAALVAGPAAAESIHVVTVGKTSEQVAAEVRTAATTLCREQKAQQPLGFYFKSCVTATADAALAQTRATTQVAVR